MTTIHEIAPVGEHGPNEFPDEDRLSAWAPLSKAQCLVLAIRLHRVRSALRQTGTLTDPRPIEAG